ncbi:MAG: RNA polymerase sigma factor [Phycisphaerae bacterium]|nr:RNA polymerase sigma factor [Phycisphaerae bacterium]
MAPTPRNSDDDRSRTELASLLAAAAAGDERAWRGLVDAYVGRVFGLIRSQCGDADLADEITQSTFCTIAAKLREYEEVGRFESWLFRIAMNRLRDEMRRRKRQASPMDAAPMVTLAIEAPGSGATVPKDAATSRVLRDAIASLNEADREIINLRHVGGLSFKQLADALDEPLGTLLARHHRALRKLREYLEERGIDAEVF